MVPTRLRDIGEEGLLERILPRLAGGAGVLVGPGDDAAVIAVPPNAALAFASDAMTEGVHFDLALMSAQDVGWRLVCANLSDLAAMGADAGAAVVSVAAPGDAPVAIIDDFYTGLLDLARRAGLAVVGGDVVASPGPLFFAMAVVGWVARDRSLTRRGANVGDAVVVTGETALAAAGLDVLKGIIVAEGPDVAAAIARYRRPTLALALARALARTAGVTAAIDTSDSLAISLNHLAKASGVGIRIDAGVIPVAAAALKVAAASGRDAVSYGLEGGEDFELLLTCRPDATAAVLAAAAAEGVRASVIGEVTGGSAGVVLSRDGRDEPLNARGFAHF